MKRLTLAIALLACASAAEAKTFKIKAGPNAAAELQAAALKLKPGDSVRLGAGTFELSETILIKGEALRVRGAGADKTILSFKGLEKGDGIVFTGRDMDIQDLSAAEGEHASISVMGGEYLRFKNVAALGAREGCAFHISNSTRLTAEGLVAKNGKYGGLCVDDSSLLVLKNVVAEGSAIGVSLANVRAADLIDAKASGNGVGVAVTATPGSKTQDPGMIRIVNAAVTGNNAAGFPLKHAAPAQSGVGVAVLANRDVSIEGGEIAGHDSANVFIGAYGGKIDTEDFNALPRRVAVRKTALSGGGGAPKGAFATLPPGVLQAADIVWDGATAYVSAGRPKTEPVLIDARGARTLSIGLAAAGQPLEDGLANERIPPVTPFDPPAEVTIR